VFVTASDTLKLSIAVMQLFAISVLSIMWG